MGQPPDTKSDGCGIANENWPDGFPFGLFQRRQGDGQGRQSVDQPQDNTGNLRTDKRAGDRNKDQRPAKAGKSAHQTGEERQHDQSGGRAGLKRHSVPIGEVWRRRPESNRYSRICNPVRNHSATSPWMVRGLAIASIAKPGQGEARVRRQLCRDIGHCPAIVVHQPFTAK